MKKLLIIVLSMLFVASAFTAVYADDAGMDSVRATVPGSKIILGGDAYVTGVWNKNYDLNSDVDTDDRYWTQRVRLKVTAKLGEGVEVRTRTVLMERDWGVGNLKDMNFDYAYLHIPVNDITVDIGRQKAKWGNTFLLDQYEETKDRLKITSKVQDAVVGVFIDKILETDVPGDDNLNDVDDIGVFATQKLGDIEAGGTFIYHNDDTAVATNLKGQIIDVFANGKVGDIGVVAEFAMKSGDFYEDADGNSQMGLFVQASKAIDDAITVSGVIAYAANAYTADEHFTPTVFVGTDQDTAMMDFGAMDDETAFGVVISADYKVSSDLSVSGAGAYASLGGAKYDGSGDDATLTEIDAKLSYALAKNTTYSVDFGYLMPSGMSASDDAAIALAHTVSIAF